MPPYSSEPLHPFMRKVTRLTRLLQHTFILWTFLRGEASNIWDLRHKLLKPQQNTRNELQGELYYPDERSAVETHYKQLEVSGFSNTVPDTQRLAIAPLPVVVDLAKRPLSGIEKASIGLGGHSAWSMRFPDVILGTSALNVLTANVQPNRTPETDDILLNDPHNKQSPLSFLVDTIKLPLVSGLREADEQRSSAGVISQGEHDPKPTEDEELQRRDGYIVGEEYSGPGFQPADQVILEDPPLFAMQNISLLPPQARKPINLAVRQFTAQMQRAAVEYCTANNLNCSEQHALETAISVALRTSPTASMFRQISASLSAMEGAITSALRPLGWPVDPRSPEAPKPPPKPRVQITQAVQFAFSLVGTAVALLRSFIHITKGPTPLITLDTQLHEHHRNILSKLLYSGREIEGCSMTVPLRHLSNCRSFAIEVPARTDKCSVPATTQANAPSSLTVHGFELACLASLRCSQHYTAYQPFNLDGRYILTPSSDGAVSFAKTIPRAFSQENIPAGVLHLYRSEEGKANSDILKYTIAAVSAAPVQTLHCIHKILRATEHAQHTDRVAGPFAYLPVLPQGPFANQQSSQPKECQGLNTFAFPHCLLHGSSHWRFTQVRPESPPERMKSFPAVISVR